MSYSVITVSGIDKDNKVVEEDLIYEQILPPHTAGGKLVKLKSEFVFADYNLTAKEQLLLFLFMSKFDTEPFLTSPVVLEKLYVKGVGWDWSKLTSELTDEVYMTRAYRTIILPASYISGEIEGGRKGNYKGIEKTLCDFQRKIMIMNTKQGGKTSIQHLSPIECTKIYKDSGGVKVLVTFSQSFMPYMLAFSNYQTAQMDILTRLKSKYSIRLYHWFLYALLQYNGARVKLPVDIIRKRLQIEDSKFKRMFLSRVITEPCAELCEKSDLDIEVITHHSKKRGAPIESIEFVISRKGTGGVPMRPTRTARVDNVDSKM